MRKYNNQIDHPVTIFREHNILSGESVMIIAKPGSDSADSVNHFMKPKTIAGIPKNTFGKIKNYIYLFSNQFTGNNLQGVGKKLKGQELNLKIPGNSLKG